MPNRTLTVCSGATKIARGIKQIPNGFIATIDANLTTIHNTWRRVTKFVWCVTLGTTNNLTASAFNGVRSHIIEARGTSYHTRPLQNLLH